MQPRLERLQPMLGNPLFESILWGHEYDLSGLNNDLRERIESGQFKRLVFYGMGCSSVVSDIVKGFFLNQKIPLSQAFSPRIIQDKSSDPVRGRSALLARRRSVE